MSVEQKAAGGKQKAAIYLFGQSAFLCLLSTVILRISAGQMELMAITLVIYLIFLAIAWLMWVAPPQLINMPGLNDEQKVESARRTAKVYLWGSLAGIWLTVGGAPEPVQFGWIMVFALYPVFEVVRPFLQPKS